MDELIVDTGESQSFGPWYNPRTGQQFERLPTDPLGIQTGMRKKWIPGRAPIELQAKWEASQAERDTAYEKSLKEQRKKNDVDIDKADKTIAASTDEVAAAVIDKLIALGVIEVPGTPTEEKIDIEDEVSQEPVQMKLFS